LVGRGIKLYPNQPTKNQPRTTTTTTNYDGDHDGRYPKITTEGRMDTRRKQYEGQKSSKNLPLATKRA
jgi:hypothetical protein